MKRIYFAVRVLVWLLFLSGCSNLPSLLTEVAGTPKQFQSRQIIVTLSEDIRSQWEAINREILNKFDVQAVGKFPLSSIRVNCLVYRVSETVEVDEIMRRLSADNRIELVQSNQVFAGLQAGSNIAYGSLSYGPRMIHANLVRPTVTGKGVTIAVIDTGADKEHPDLKGRVAAIHNFVEGGDISIEEDRHGIAVAGIIAARAGDGIGIDGIAPDARVDIYKACWYADKSKDKALCSSWTLAKALDAAIATGSHIINLSLSGPDDALLNKLLVTADKHHILLVAAAMENSSEPGFPASLDFVIPVISAGPNGDTAHPHWKTKQQVIAAPGLEILTTAPHNSYAFLSGSSLAAAHVSGVAALLLQYQPGLEPAALTSALKQSGQPKTVNQDKGSSIVLIDACRALVALGSAVACP